MILQVLMSYLVDILLVHIARFSHVKFSGPEKPAHVVTVFDAIEGDAGRSKLQAHWLTDNRTFPKSQLC